MTSPIPVELIFNQNWWFRNYGISFNEAFYLDRETRIANDLVMRSALYQRFGIGDPHPHPRPVVGSQFVAGGFVVEALLGAAIRFSRYDAPWPVSSELNREQVMALRVPDLQNTWPMSQLIADMDSLEREYGAVIGDFNTDGVINTALHLRGQQLFLDLIEDEELVRHLFRVIADTQIAVARSVRPRTGTASVSVNRSILNVDARIFLTSNCSVQMISPRLYRDRLLEWDCYLARRLEPFGIHHCGNNLHLFAPLYAESQAVFYDAGWGSDVALVSSVLPDAFLNLRLSPVRMLSASADEVRRDAVDLLRACGRKSKVGLCCINMDYGTPDENVHAIFEAAGSFLDGTAI